MTALVTALEGSRVVICAGAGGVGKTTVSATVALGLAARGYRVALVTIDPARRLAESLGLDQLDNNPRRVDTSRLTRAGFPIRGELDAMMLDVKRTFDELIVRLAPDERTHTSILANPIYQHLSTAVGGSQEYTAMAKLFEINHQGGHDVIVLDTPPSRNAIDFLQAPDRLLAFLEGRALAALLSPAGSAVRAAGLVFAVLRRITGVQLLDDLTSFFGLLSGLFDGFRQRAVDVKRLLADPTSTFLIVTSPERAAVDETIFFARELDHQGLHRAGVIVNRMHPVDPDERDPASTTERLTRALDATLAKQVALVHAELQLLARRDQRALARLHRELAGTETSCLVDREQSVHDLDGLRSLHDELFRPSARGTA